MIQEAIKIEVPDKALDPLASIVASRWNAAVMWRGQEKIGGKSLSKVLTECYEQREGIASCADREIIEELGVDLHVNLSGLKVSALVSWMRDLLVNTPEMPFTIDPTPKPELSDKARRSILTSLKQELFMNGFDGDLMGLVKSLKYKQLNKEREYAATAAGNMSRLIKDQCIEGGFRASILKTINDFATYPFAVLHGPIPTMRNALEWRGDKLVPKTSLAFQFEPTSVFDFFWSPDSRDAQTGTGVFVRQRITKQQLYQCLNIKSYIKENILKIIEDTISSTQHLHWTSRNPEQPDTIGNGWGNGETLEVLRHYGLFSGRELSDYGISGLEYNEFYEACVSVIGRRTIQAFINPNPNVSIRPVYTASFETTADRIPGVSICQKIRDVERAYLATLRFLMVNCGFAAGPIGEVDYSRIQKYMNPEDVGRLAALTLYPTDPSMYGGSEPAHRLHNVNANMGAFTNVSQFFMDLADRVTQIPASIHGEPVGTGANRTFRGMAMLYGNAIKPIQSGIANMDVGIFAPMGELMYNYNMRYSDDDSIKGDAKVQAQGATGLIGKEVAKQNAFDTLQLIATAGSAAQGMIQPEVMAWAVRESLRASGVPIDELTPQQSSGAGPQGATPLDAMQGQDMPQQPIQQNSGVQ